MSRLSIEWTRERQRLKAMTVLQGKRIKAYVIDQSLPNLPDRDFMSEEEAVHQLEQFLSTRIQAAERGERSSRTPHQILADVQQDLH